MCMCMYWLMCKYSISEKIVQTTVTQESGTAFSFPMQRLYQNSEIIRVFHIEKAFLIGIRKAGEDGHLQGLCKSRTLRL